MKIFFIFILTFSISSIHAMHKSTTLLYAKIFGDIKLEKNTAQEIQEQYLTCTHACAQKSASLHKEQLSKGPLYYKFIGIHVATLQTKQCFAICKNHKKILMHDLEED